MTAAATDPDPRAARLLAMKAAAKPPQTVAARVLAALRAEPGGLTFPALVDTFGAPCRAVHGLRSVHSAALRSALDRLLIAGTVRSIPVRRHCGEMNVLYYVPSDPQGDTR